MRFKEDKEISNMRRASFSLFLIFFAYLSFGNIAAPIHIPEKIGDLFTQGETANPIRIEKETLILDVTGIYAKPGESRATYVMINPGKDKISLPMLFLTPGAKEISVSVDGVAMQSRNLTIPFGAVPWAADDKWDVKLPDYGAAAFEVVFGPGEKKTLEVAFRLTSGYDNTLVDRGMTAPQAAHVLNQFKDQDASFWYRYDLFASTSFKGGFGTLDITIKVPLKNEVIANLDLKKSEDNYNAGYYTLSGTFDGLPSKVIDIKRIYKVAYNTMGATIAAGCAFPFDGRVAHFTSKVLFDAFFANHEVSAGIEADPFSGYYHGLLLYTLFPPGKAGTYGWFVDIRGGLGMEFDLANGFSPGFTVFCGLKLIPVVYEVLYEIFPFGSRIIHELGVTIEMGI
jgi:hypothetical protein